jgi:hypothetical protein
VAIDLEVFVSSLLVLFVPALLRVFNRPVEKFVEKPTSD